MALADALAPEGVIRAVRQDGLGVQPVQGEESRIPAHRNDGHFSALFRGGIHRREMLGDLRMGVKAVDYMIALCKAGRLLWQIGGAAAAQNHHVNGVFHRVRLLHRIDRPRPPSEFEPPPGCAG